MFLIGRIKYCSRAWIPRKLTATKKAASLWAPGSELIRAKVGILNRPKITNLFCENAAQRFLATKRGAQ